MRSIVAIKGKEYRLEGLVPEETKQLLSLRDEMGRATLRGEPVPSDFVGRVVLLFHTVAARSQPMPNVQSFADQLDQYDVRPMMVALFTAAGFAHPGPQA